jgi:hypothetical protein
LPSLRRLKSDASSTVARGVLSGWVHHRILGHGKSGWPGSQYGPGVSKKLIKSTAPPAAPWSDASGTQSARSQKTMPHGMWFRLLATRRPVITTHPNALATNLDRVSAECYVEINNRYIWRCDWHAFYGPYCGRFRLIISSDAHQPNRLGQSVARCAAAELGIEEQLLFK